MSYILSNGQKYMKAVDTKDMGIHSTNNPPNAKK